MGDSYTLTKIKELEDRVAELERRILEPPTIVKGLTYPKQELGFTVFAYEEESEECSEV